MRILLATCLALFLAAPGTAQVCGALVPSGQPAIEGHVPLCSGLVAPPVVWAFGNAGFAVHANTPPPLPTGQPTWIFVGLPVPPPVAIFAPLDGFYGLPGLLAMQSILAALPAGISGGVGPAVPLPAGLSASC